MTSTEANGGTVATGILDVRHDAVRALTRTALDLAGDGDPRALLRQAHRLIASTVRPVYALEELQPVSVTLRRKRGSCSQRLAALEAVARAGGIPTRCRGLLVDGSFWYPRFPSLVRLVPDVAVLAWPEFRLNDQWVPASELFGSPTRGTRPFTNSGTETLYDAIARRAVDCPASCPTAQPVDGTSLAAAVVRDLGHHDSRDELFAAHGQTLSWAVRAAAGPVLSRISAGGR